MSLPTFEEVVALKESGVPNIWKYLAEKYNENPERLRGIFRRESDRRRIQEESVLTEDTLEVESSVPEDKDFVSQKATSFDEEGKVKQITSRQLIEMSEEEEKSPAFVLKAHGFNVDEWILVSVINNYWQGMRPKDRGEVTLYQSKITVKPKNTQESLTLKDINNFFVSYKSDSFSVPTVIHSKNKRGLILEVNLADVHVGNDIVSFEELRNRVSYLLEDLKFKISKYDFEKIVVAEIGDILHCDTYNKTTTSGTVIGTKNSAYEIFDDGTKLLIWFLEELSNIKPVEFISIAGNHDRFISYALSKAVEFYFRNNSNITFDNGHEDRKYRVLGNTLVGWAHGDMGYKNLKNVLQTEARREYGISDFAEMHVGHVHHELVKDEGSVIVRFLSSITSPDSWHKKEGYVGAKQGTMSFVWGNDGLKEVWYTGLP
jgi:hypothetical protein